MSARSFTGDILIFVFTENKEVKWIEVWLALQ